MGVSALYPPLHPAARAVPRVLTVVLHYGSASMTRQLVQALEQGAGPNPVLVVDNAAPEVYDGALRLPQNVFWGGALEHALHLARQDDFSHVWFCNNDIRFTSPAPYIPRALGRLAYAQKILGRPVGLWAPAVHRNPYHPQMVQRENVEFSTVAYADGIAPLLSLECVQAIGGLDCADNLRGYGLDLWLSFRAHQAGWPVVLDHHICLKHDYHSTAKAVDGFLAQAAADEQAYLSARLGQQWRECIKAMQHCVQDYIS